jgi:ferric-dicitrate binding protein FerR (iron transport regulator)
MSKRSVGITVAGLAVVGLLALLLRGYFGGGPVIARLTEMRGPAVERDYAAEQGRWEATKPGAEFVAGDGMRTSAQTTAKLQLADASQLSVMPSTTLRFLAHDEADGAFNLDLLSGEAVIRVSDKDLRLRTHVGLAIIEGGTLVSLTRADQAMRFAVQLGSLSFQDGRSLHTGEQLLLGIGAAVLAAEPRPEVVPARRLMLDVQGAGVRARREGSRSWQELPAGSHEAEPGTELRLASASKASLTRGADRAELQGAGEYVVGTGPGMLEARGGELALSSADEDLEVRVPGGVIIVRKQPGGSQAKLRLGAEQGELKVLSGTVTATLNGTTEELSAGDQRSWATEAPDGESEQAGESAGPSYVNLAAPAGESFVLHAPELPVSVAFAFGTKCPDQGEVELIGKRQRARGKGSANLLLPAGTRSYAVRCLNAAGTPGRVVARGTLHVLLDAGTRKLPPIPPTSFVEADGRTYTVYYPNQLPDLSIRWPNAPQEQSYVLEVDGKSQDVPAPEYLFKSGSLRDGTHQVSFRASSRRSRTTTIEVRFDNNAPTASLNQPADRSFGVDAEVKVEGVSLQAWKVSLEGGTISKESDGRFTGLITPTAGRPDIAVRLSHPRLGIHYYLRRAASSP